MTTRFTGASIVVILGLTTVATCAAGGVAGPPLAPQFQREMLQLKLHQSQAAQGLNLDAGARLQFEQLRLQQLRQQQATQQRQQPQRSLLEQLVRQGAVPPAALVNQEQLLKRERQQQQQRFDLELEQWRLRRSSDP